MAKTPSTMIQLGTIAPYFNLRDTLTGNFIALDKMRSEVATVIIFTCNHCPYVKHIQTKLLDVIKKYQKKGIQFIAINSNDVDAYPEDSPENMRLEALRLGFTFPYLFDETQEVARLYHAACTPDFFIFNKELACVYRGRFDSATPGNQDAVTGKDLSNALENILAGEPVNPNQYPSYGCNIKWKQKIKN